VGSTHSNLIPVGEGGVTPFVAWLNRWRITIGTVVLGVCVAKTIIRREAPCDILKPSALVISALVLIVLGAATRIWALGTIDKNRVLTTLGIYSLCRNPLYVGSTLLYLGFALLMNNPPFLYLGLPYVFLFFSAAAFSEEHFLKSKFGPEFETYRHMVPGFVPLGRWRSGTFSFSRAMKKGGLQLILVVIVLLAGIEYMARTYTA
jgi:protein-S-isoprenylcysteine O-methyltransferase Ste14